MGCKPSATMEECHRSILSPERTWQLADIEPPSQPGSWPCRDPRPDSALSPPLSRLIAQRVTVVCLHKLQRSACLYLDQRIS